MLHSRQSEVAYLDEAQVEIVTVDYFRELGYEYVHGPLIEPDGDALLPKLLSGNIRMAEAKSLVQETV
jgi:hypothetical protein